MASLIPSGSATGSGSVTLTVPTTNSNQTATLPDATGTVMVSGNQPAFSAYKNDGAQSITSATFTKVTFSAELFDTNNNFASSTFTPTVAGYYQISAGLSSSGSGTLSRAILLIYKNGSAIYTLQDVFYSGAGLRYSGSCLVQCNGTTDYIEAYIYLTGTSPIAESGLIGTGYATWFNGALVRTA